MTISREEATASSRLRSRPGSPTPSGAVVVADDDDDGVAGAGERSVSDSMGAVFTEPASFVPAVLASWPRVAGVQLKNVEMIQAQTGISSRIWSLITHAG